MHVFRMRFFITVCSLVLALCSHVSGQCEMDRLIPSDAMPGSLFSYSTDVSDGVVMIGDPFDFDAGDYAGSVYVYGYDGTKWVERQKLIPANVAPWDFFGAAIDIEGNVAVIGSAQQGVKKPGYAIVYQFDGVRWVEKQTLTASDGAADDYFGGAIAIGGQQLLISAIGHSKPGEYWSTVYVFRWNDTQWEEVQKINNLDPFISYFGNRIVVENGIAIIGSVDGAFEYHFDGNQWISKGTMQHPVDGFEFDSGMAMSDETLLISDTSSFSHRAFYFRRVHDQWELVQHIIAPDPSSYTFGSFIALDGDTAIIGAPYDRTTGERAGAAFLYKRINGEWTLQQQFLPEVGGEHTRFGWPVALDDDVFVIGAPGDKSTKNAIASAYISRISAGASASCAADIAGGCVIDPGDGFINTLDLLELLSNWNTAGPGANIAQPADGVVNAQDLFALLSDWGHCQ